MDRVKKYLLYLLNLIVMKIQRIKIIRIKMNEIFLANNIKKVNITRNMKEYFKLIILDLIRSINERRDTINIK